MFSLTSPLPSPQFLFLTPYPLSLPIHYLSLSTISPYPLSLPIHYLALSLPISLIPLFFDLVLYSAAGVLKNQQIIIQKETDKQKKNLKQNNEKLELLNNKSLNVS
jgi:hypothetical protein